MRRRPRPARTSELRARAWRRVFVTLALSAAAGCAPLTFSKTPLIDFDRYPSVLVTVTSGNAAGDTGYLAADLRDTSGFALVTTDPGATTSLVLDVKLVVTESTAIDLDGNVVTSWRGDASYAATDAAGAVVDKGAELADSDEGASKVATELLDTIGLRYLRPYRI